MPDDQDQHLKVEVEGGLPSEFAVGLGNALFVHGWCYHRERRISRLSIRIADREQPVLAHSMPRADVLRRRDPGEDPRGHAFRSGFWTILPIAQVAGETSVEVEVVAHFAGGRESSRRLGAVTLRPSLPPPGKPVEAVEPVPAEPLVAICMATFNPEPELLRRQLDSIRGQTHRNWLCVISDDGSFPDAYAALKAEVAGDDRFHLSRAEHRLGYYHNFERALRLVPASAQFVALADQDDSWYPEKVAALHEAIKPGVALAYSDMRIVDAQGEVISSTYWTERRNNFTSLTELTVANTVTAAASLFPRELLDLALPFPTRIGHAFHDQWLAMVALASGRIAYLDRPLYDYRQHGGNAFGTRGAAWPRRRLPRRPPSRTSISLQLLRWRTDYFEVVVPARLQAEVLALRCGDRLRGRSARAIRMFRSSERGFAAIYVTASLWLRSVASKPRRSPTMGRERLVARGLLWRRLIGVITLLRRRRREYHAQGRAVPPPPSIEPDSVDPPALVEDLTKKLAPIPLEIDRSARPRLNILIPTVDLDHFFGAYIGKFNLARRLAEAGLNVRLVAVDPTYLPTNWRDRVAQYEGLGSLLDRVEVEFAPTREQLRLRVSPDDCFVATTSWTAHLAHRASSEIGRRRFVFVIQEYDPLTYPVGTRGAITRQAYAYPHLALFSTEFLRDFFRRRRIGVYADDQSQGDSDALVFENAITRIEPPTPEELRRRDRRLLFYARPELHAERNLYELGLIALNEAIGEGCFPDRWRFSGIGALEKSSVRLGNGTTLHILGRRDQDSYRRLLLQHSVGISLQDTPHPSLVPLEMASAGMPVVTSTFENKTAEALREISENLIPVEPTTEAIKAGLFQAVASLGDVERRAEQAAVRWSRSWEETFNDEIVAGVKEFVERA